MPLKVIMVSVENIPDERLSEVLSWAGEMREVRVKQGDKVTAVALDVAAPAPVEAAIVSSTPVVPKKRRAAAKDEGDKQLDPPPATEPPVEVAKEPEGDPDDIPFGKDEPAASPVSPEVTAAIAEIPISTNGSHAAQEPAQAAPEPQPEPTPPPAEKAASAPPVASGGVVSNELLEALKNAGNMRFLVARFMEHGISDFEAILQTCLKLKLDNSVDLLIRAGNLEKRLRLAWESFKTPGGASPTLQ